MHCLTLKTFKTMEAKANKIEALKVDLEIIKSLQEVASKNVFNFDFIIKCGQKYIGIDVVKTKVRGELKVTCKCEILCKYFKEERKRWGIIKRNGDGYLQQAYYIKKVVEFIGYSIYYGISDIDEINLIEAKFTQADTFYVSFYPQDVLQGSGKLYLISLDMYQEKEFNDVLINTFQKELKEDIKLFYQRLR